MPFIKYEPFPPYHPWTKSNGPCKHPEHNPPGMIVLQPGIHTYKCPGCGQIHEIHVPERPTVCCSKSHEIEHHLANEIDGVQYG